MNKKFLLVAILMFALAGLFACEEIDDEGVTITYWHTHGDAESEILTDVVMPMWEEAHPDITVEVVRQDGSQYHEMIVISFGTGNGPDVARIDITNTASYAAEGGLVALEQYDDFDALKDTFLDGPLSTNLYKGSYYGLPLDTNCKVAVVNTLLLESELGLTDVPETMEAFIEAARGRGTHSLNVSGVGDWDLYPYFWLFGGVLTDEGYTQASGYLDSEESIEAIETMISLMDEDIFTIRDVDGTADAWAGINDTYVMFFEGPWFGFSEDIIPATIPTYEGRSASVVGGENIAVFATSDEQDAAYEFAKFMTSEAVQLEMLKAGQLPVLKSLVTHEDVLEDAKWSVFMSQLESAQARIPSPNNEDIKTIWSNAMNNIFINGEDVRTELENAALLMDEELE